MELGKNAEKEYFKPQGYECLRTKILQLAKRASMKDSDKLKESKQIRSESEESRSNESEEGSLNDGISDHEEDLNEDESNQMEDELVAPLPRDKLEALGESKQQSLCQRLEEKPNKGKILGLKVEIPPIRSIYGPQRPALQQPVPVIFLLTSKKLQKSRMISLVKASSIPYSVARDTNLITEQS